jgi:hypothetical protein
VSARGTAGNDRIMLSRTGDDVRVSIADRDTGKLLLAQKFDAAKVKGLTVDAGAGDDAIENGFRNTRGVDGAVIKPGTGTNLVYNNGAAAHLQGSQDKAADAVGDIVLNEGARARIDGSSGADHIVSNGVGSRISAASKGDLTVATGRDQQIDVGADGPRGVQRPERPAGRARARHVLAGRRDRPGDRCPAGGQPAPRHPGAHAPSRGRVSGPDRPSALGRLGRRGRRGRPHGRRQHARRRPR